MRNLDTNLRSVKVRVALQLKTKRMYSRVWTTHIIGRVEGRQKLNLLPWSCLAAARTTFLLSVSLSQSLNRLLSTPRLLPESKGWWWWMLPPKIIRNTNSSQIWKPYLQASQHRLGNINLQITLSITWAKLWIYKRLSRPLMILPCSSGKLVKA